MVNYRSIAEAVGLMGLVVFMGMALSAEKAYYCEDSGLAMNCDSLSKYYSLPNGKCNNAEYGNKVCRSGWERFEIIEEPAPGDAVGTFKVSANGGTYDCSTDGEYVGSYTHCKKDDGKEGYLGELV